MMIRNPRRRVVTAVGAATIALAAAGTGQAGAVGGPEYGIVPVSEAAIVEKQAVGTSSARRPLPLESLQQVRAARRTTPVVDDAFDWTDAGIGAAGASADAAGAAASEAAVPIVRIAEAIEVSAHSDAITWR